MTVGWLPHRMKQKELCRVPSWCQCPSRQNGQPVWGQPGPGPAAQGDWDVSSLCPPHLERGTSFACAVEALV